MTKEKLSDIAKVIDCKHRTPQYITEGIPVVSPGSISWGNIDLKSPTKRVSLEEYTSLMDHCIVEVGDLVMSRNQSIGIASYVNTLDKFVLGQDTILIKSQTCNSHFLFQILQSSIVQNQIFKFSGGSTFSRINLKDIRKLQIPLPPLPEQKKIATILTTWDEAIDKVQSLIDSKEEQKKGLMQRLLTGEQRLAGFNEEWKEVRLGEVADKFKGKIVETNEERKGKPYIGASSFDGNFILFSESEKAVLCSEEDVLMLWDGENAGKVTSGLNGIVSSTVCVFRTSNFVTGTFLYYKLNELNYLIRATRTGSGIPHVDKSLHKWLKFYIPNIQEQKAISEILNQSQSEIDLLHQKKVQMELQKKGLMQQLLTGKMRVTSSEKINN